MLSSIKKTLHLREWIISNEEGLNKKPDIASITAGDIIVFGVTEQKELSQKRCIVGEPSIYHFHGSQFTSYPLLTVQHQPICQMIIAGNEGQTPYLALSKRVSDAHKMELCIDEDYKRLCKGDLPQHLYVREHTAGMSDWLYMHYETKIDHARGTVISANDDVKTFGYSLYVSLKEYKALELERSPSGELAIYATVFRPASDILAIHKGAADRIKKPDGAKSTVEKPSQSSAPIPNASALSEEPSKPAKPIVKETLTEPDQSVMSPLAAKPGHTKTDQDKDSAKIFTLPMSSQVPTRSEVKKIEPTDKQVTQYSQVKCNLRMASKLVDEALRNDMRVTDVIRKALGLSINSTDHITFDLQLTEADYKILADRFDLDISDKNKIHELIMEELGHFTGEPD